jgi:hypothetical protein
MGDLVFQMQTLLTQGTFFCRAHSLNRAMNPMDCAVDYTIF